MLIFLIHTWWDIIKRPFISKRLTSHLHNAALKDRLINKNNQILCQKQLDESVKYIKTITVR